MQKDPKRYKHSNNIIWSWSPRTKNASSLAEEIRKLTKINNIPKSMAKKVK